MFLFWGFFRIGVCTDFINNPNSKISETIETVASIDDLLIEIFVRLPLKPLTRFRLVSKHWNSIISDERFQFMQSQEHNNRAVGLIFQNYRRGDLPPLETRVVSFNRSSNPLPQIVLPNTLRIFHSCHGLLVLKNTAFSKHYYYVYNPTTNKKTTPLLIKDLNARPQDRVVGMYLAFDPTKSPYYKVVCVWKLNNQMDQYQFGVYSSETGSLEIRGGGIFTGSIDFNNGVYWNGAIHWVNCFGKSMYFNPNHDEVPRVMPTPPLHGASYVRCRFIGESCDHLHCAFVGGGHLPEIYVYELRRDYSEWFLKYRVDGQCLRNYTVRYLYSVVRGKKGEDSLVFGTNEQEIIRCNLVHNTFQTIRVKAFAINSRMTKSFQYIESPCSV